MCDVNWIRLAQPYMAIDARSFVPPPLTESSVHANNQDVLSAIVHKIAYVVAEWCVAASMSPEVNSIEHGDRVAEHAIEFDPDAAPCIGCGHVKNPAVPAYAGGWIIPSQWLITMAVELRDVFEIESHRPIVRNVNRAPLAVIEVRL